MDIWQPSFTHDFWPRRNETNCAPWERNKGGENGSLSKEHYLTKKNTFPFAFINSQNIQLIYNFFPILAPALIAFRSNTNLNEV
jgi:hypothetical protein